MPPPRPMGASHAAHQAVQRTRMAHAVVQHNMMRQNRNRAPFVNIVTRQPAPDTTSLGLEVTRTFTIKRAGLDNGIIHDELLEGETVLWSGVGDDPAEGLLQIIVRITEGDGADGPDN